MRFGVVIFRWAILASVIVTFSSISFSHRGILIIPDIAFGLMRSVSILELCLLAFPLPQHERAAPFAARHGFWHCARLWPHVGQRLYPASLWSSTHRRLLPRSSLSIESLILVASGYG